MANLLGEYLLKAADDYKKSDFENYNDYFETYFNAHLKNSSLTLSIIDDFILNAFSLIDDSTTNAEIQYMLNNLYNLLFEKKLILKQFDVGCLVGAILLGNLYNNKKED